VVVKNKKERGKRAKGGEELLFRPLAQIGSGTAPDFQRETLPAHFDWSNTSETWHCETSWTEAPRAPYAI